MEKLWPAFFSEVSEQMDSLEVGLVSATRGESPDVHQLFRDFHTIKSSCAMMGFEGMEAIAHASEDLLDQVRQGQAPLDGILTDLLLEALDTVKQQLSRADETREPPEAVPELVERLRNLHENRGGNARADTDADDEDAGDQGEDETAEADRRESMEALHALARHFTEHMSGLLEGGEDSARAARALAAPAEEAGMVALTTLLQRLGDLQEEAEALDEPSLAVLSDLLQRLSYLERQAEIDLGVAEARARLRRHYSEQFRNQALDFAERIGAAETEGADELLTIAEAALELEQFAYLLGHEDSGRLLRLIAQVLREQVRGNRESDPETRALLSIAGGLPAELDVEGEDADYQGVCRQTLESLLARLRGETASGEQDPLERLRVSPEFPELLTAEVRRALGEALDAGREVAEIEADLESDQSRGEALYNWLAEQADMLNSHTVFHHDDEVHGSGTRIRFLTTFADNPDAFMDKVRQQDPEHRYLLVHPLSFEPVGPQDGADQTAGEAAPAQSGEAPEARPADKAASRTGDTLRVESGRLDSFVHRVGEMVTLRNILSHRIHDERWPSRLRDARRLIDEARRGSDADALDKLESLLDTLAEREEQLEEVDASLDTALDRLQDEALELRVVPVRGLLDRLPRVAYQIGRQSGKSVRMELEDNGVRIDKGMTEALLEPLTHMVRNAIDHGIESPEERERAGKAEQARLAVTASHGGTGLLLEMEDDGRGLDLDAIRDKALERGLVSREHVGAMADEEVANLIFEPGFSTARTITETSGRGVGMDLVRARLQEIGGRVEVSTEAGRGTRFRMELPLSAAIQNVVMVRDGDTRMAIPERHITETLELGVKDLHRVQGQAAVALRGTPVPVFRLTPLLWPGSRDEDSAWTQDRLQLVVVTSGENRIALAVEQIEGRQELFVREMHDDLRRVRGLGGCAVGSDGQVVIIADCDALLNTAAHNAQSLSRFQNAS